MPTDSGFLEVPGGQLFYERAGQGPPVVCVHASIVDRRMWDREADVYSKTHQVVRYDLRGLGRSSAASGPFSYSADLHAVLQQLRTGPVTLVGCSVGGRIAIDFALEHPEAVRALLLVAPGLSGWTPAMDPEGQAVFDQDSVRSAELPATWFAGRHEEAVEGLLEYWCSATKGTTREFARKMIRDSAREFFTDRTERHSVAPERPAAQRLDSIRVPTTVMLGDRDEPTMAYIVRRVARGIPGARLVEVPGADHLINLSAPEAFDAELRRALG